MNPQETVKDFLSGKLDIVTFRRMYDQGNEINDFLQGIIDDMKANHTQPLAFTTIIGDREFTSSSIIPYLLSLKEDRGIAYGCPPQYTSVRQCLTYEFRMVTHDVETAAGASQFYEAVYSIYYQIDQSVDYFYRYIDAFGFALDVIPEYLSGGEAEKYIQKHIIPLYPETMKKTERKKAIKAKIKEDFKSEKGYPCWPQHSDWPIGKDGKPTTYIGKGKSEGDLRRFRFRDETTGEIITVEQFY